VKKHLLRFGLALLIVNCSLFIGKAQYVAINDTNFLNKLIALGYSPCLSGNLLDTTCNKVLTDTLLDVSNTSNTPDSLKIHDLNGVQYFKALRKLNCEFNANTTLLALPTTLKYLYCDWDSLISLPALPASLSYLDCYRNQISSLPSLPASLSYLDCSQNQISTLPALPASLTSFGCSFNPLSSLPTLPTTLKYLYCEYDSLTSLPALPSSLLHLACNNNKISALPTLPTSLSILWCCVNLLTNLPALPASVTELNCGDNQLSSLPTLPPSLTYLACTKNQLSSLPTLPAPISFLACSNNGLISLPSLPASITKFFCDHNLLSSLPSLPASLTVLSCTYNQLSTLPALPASLTSFACRNNLLTSIPDLPDSLNYFSCLNNPNLTCLPALKKVVNFYFDSTSITCLPNYPQRNTHSSPALSTVPLCDGFGGSGCSFYWSIDGKVYNDTAAVCDTANTGTLCANIKVLLDSAGTLQQKFSAVYGVYSFPASFGAYQLSVDTVQMPFYVSCPVSGGSQAVVSTANPLDSNVNFGIKCKPGFDLAALSIVGRFRPGNTRRVNVSTGDLSNFYQMHCVNGISGKVQLVMPPVVTYVSPFVGALTPTSISADTVTWNIADFGTVDFFNAFNFMAKTDSNAVSGTTICFTLIVTPINGDLNPANNILTKCFVITNSCDPNEKEADPAAAIDTAQKWITYTIHFQNTGNDTAYTIYIKDTLDNNLDASSFSLLAYSHAVETQLKCNLMRFNFPNINLPDSNTNEPLSHGYVQYKVKLKDNLPLGTQIKNTAYIYFDFNSPVITNTTLNTIAAVTGIPQSSIATPQFEIFPNPASNNATISVDESMLGKTITVSDVTGRTVLQSKIQNLKSKIDCTGWASGVYLVRLTNREGLSAVRKLVKE
jgi:fimbrial isopeptide formation D2 family protein